MFLASPITFPNLGIEIDPSPVAFTVFGKDIYWYGIIIAAGFLLAVFYMLARAKDSTSGRAGLPSTAASSAARSRCSSLRSARKSRLPSCSTWRAWASSSASLWAAGETL